VADRRHALAHLAGGRGVERVLLALHRPAGAHVPPRAVALGHEPPHPHRLPGRQQVVGPLGPQAVGRREVGIEVPRVQCSDRGQLVDDHLRPRPAHRLGDLVGGERVGDHRHRAQLLEQRPLRPAAGHAVHLVTGGDQPRHQLPADRSGRSRHQHPHRQLLDRGSPIPKGQDGNPSCDTSGTCGGLPDRGASSRPTRPCPANGTATQPPSAPSNPPARRSPPRPASAAKHDPGLLDPPRRLPLRPPSTPQLPRLAIEQPQQAYSIGHTSGASPCRRRVDRIRCSSDPRTSRYPAVGSSAVTEDNLALDVRGSPGKTAVRMALS
jgi:hypothetical protein